MQKNIAFTTIEQYIRLFPVPVQKKLQQLRTTIRAAAPQAKEKISYQMPTFYLHGNLVHFAAYEHHIGFYPAPAGIAHFEKEIAQKYIYAKGSVQFPLNQSLPLALIKKIVKFRVSQNVKKV